MKYDLKRPCKNCPFGDTEHRIRFSCRERAEEIEESAYRYGFPCHLSADHIEETEFDSGGYVEGENTQLCIGSAMMFLADGSGSWPGINNDEDLGEKLSLQIDWTAPHFESSDDFIRANTSDSEAA